MNILEKGLSKHQKLLSNDDLLVLLALQPARVMPMMALNVLRKVRSFEKHRLLFVEPTITVLK